MECGVAVYSGLMLAARITFAHFSVSSAISLPKSAAEPGSTVPPRSANRALILASAHGALTITPISRRLSPKRTDEIVARLRMHAEAIELDLRKAAASRLARSWALYS